jgi:hypothetical protein
MMRIGLLKLPLVLVSLAITNLLISCEQKEIDSVPPTAENLRLSKISGNNNLIEYTYGARNNIIGIKHYQKLTDGSETAFNRIITYNAQGNIDREENATAFGHYTTLYKYTTGKILSQTEEYLNNEKISYTTYNYDTKGRLQVRTIFKPDEEIKEYREFQMYTYEYDSRDNLRMLVFYTKPTHNGPRQQVFYNKYEDYDNAISIEHLANQPYMPTIKLFQNNPGKEYHYEGLSTTNPIITTYYYSYNAQKLPVEKTTITATGTSITNYTYSRAITQP